MKTRASLGIMIGLFLTVLTTGEISLAESRTGFTGGSSFQNFSRFVDNAIVRPVKSLFSFGQTKAPSLENKSEGNASAPVQMSENAQTPVQGALCSTKEGGACEISQSEKPAVAESAKSEKPAVADSAKEDKKPESIGESKAPLESPVKLDSAKIASQPVDAPSVQTTEPIQEVKPLIPPTVVSVGFDALLEQCNQNGFTGSECNIDHLLTAKVQYCGRSENAGKSICLQPLEIKYLVSNAPKTWPAIQKYCNEVEFADRGCRLQTIADLKKKYCSQHKSSSWCQPVAMPLAAPKAPVKEAQKSPAPATVVASSSVASVVPSYDKSAQSQADLKKEKAQRIAEDKRLAEEKKQAELKAKAEKTRLEQEALAAKRVEEALQKKAADEQKKAEAERRRAEEKLREERRVEELKQAVLAAEKLQAEQAAKQAEERKKQGQKKTDEVKSSPAALPPEPIKAEAVNDKKTGSVEEKAPGLTTPSNEIQQKFESAVIDKNVDQVLSIISAENFHASRSRGICWMLNKIKDVHSDEVARKGYQIKDALLSRLAFLRSIETEDTVAETGERLKKRLAAIDRLAKVALQYSVRGIRIRDSRILSSENQDHWVDGGYLKEVSPYVFFRGDQKSSQAMASNDGLNLAPKEALYCDSSNGLYIELDPSLLGMILFVKTNNPSQPLIMNPHIRLDSKSDMDSVKFYLDKYINTQIKEKPSKQFDDRVQQMRQRLVYAFADRWIESTIQIAEYEAREATEKNKAYSLYFRNVVYPFWQGSLFRLWTPFSMKHPSDALNKFVYLSKEQGLSLLKYRVAKIRSQTLRAKMEVSIKEHAKLPIEERN